MIWEQTVSLSKLLKSFECFNEPEQEGTRCEIPFSHTHWDRRGRGQVSQPQRIGGDRKKNHQATAS